MAAEPWNNDQNRSRKICHPCSLVAGERQAYQTSCRCLPVISLVSQKILKPELFLAHCTRLDIPKPAAKQSLFCSWFGNVQSGLRQPVDADDRFFCFFEPCSLNTYVPGFNCPRFGSGMPNADFLHGANLADAAFGTAWFNAALTIGSRIGLGTDVTKRLSSIKGKN